MGTSNKRRLLALTVGCGIGLLVPIAVHGIDPASACGPSYIQWQKPTTAADTTATAAAHDTSFPGVTTPGAYFAQGPQLFKFQNSNGARLWSWCPPNIIACTIGQGSTTINNFPSPVPLSTPALQGCLATPCEYIFFGGADGFLYKLDAATGTSSLAADTRRRVGPTLVCNTAPGDALNATPAVVLYQFASSSLGSRGRAFRDDVDATPGHAGDDVVIALTSDGCSDTTKNRVIAYWAKDLTQKWIFNLDGTVKVDRGTEGCTIDYAAMRLYCGTDLQDGAPPDQSSLFALDVITGTLLWSTNAGAILNRPTLNFSNNRLYVVNKPGALMAYDPAGNGAGAMPLWSSPVNVAAAGTFISRAPSVESRSGTWQNRILVLDSGGTLHAVRDNGVSGAQLWSLVAGAGGLFKSVPAVLPGASESKAFIGRNDGYIQMVNLTDALPTAQGVVTVNAGPTDTYDPSFDPDSLGSLELVVVSGTTISRLKTPFCTTAPL